MTDIDDVEAELSLDLFEARVLADPDDPSWSPEKRERVHEARRRLLERIGQARQQR